MAVTARSARLALLLLFGAVLLPAQQERAIREQVAHVASALSAGHPLEAMDPFDKSCKDYSLLLTYFTGLTDAHTITNEMDINDEQIENHEATLIIHWTMTLSDLVTGLTVSREQDLTVKLSMKKYDWRIVELSPVEFFNPDPPKSK